MDYPILGYYLPFVKKAPVKSSSYSLPALIYFILDIFKVLRTTLPGVSQVRGSGGGGGDSDFLVERAEAVQRVNG
jgi:hypothetical protein